WERTRKAYDLLVHGEGDPIDDPIEALRSSYEVEEITDEFVKPKLIDDRPESRIQPGDTVIFFNIRGDRARQITRALTEEGFDKFDVEDLDLHYTTFTSYDDTFDWVHVAWPPMEISQTLGEVISEHHLKQLRIAETEKYPHVTYFFNGGEEVPFDGEERILIPSPSVATYDLQPEMSAIEVTDALCAQLITEKHHLVILNYANPDMVGHTGVMEAAVAAIETIDRQMKKLVETATDHGYKMLVIADHGNADCMIQDDGSPHTSHTTALVPAMIINDAAVTEMRDGMLADVAPTLLKLMGLEQPEEMSGKPLYG
ncbi:MAG: 2,3-bisphosphoglycerate-independent phosphoglycerate mutase, partial [Balneolaceae bacterium]|nr:2,3-bisphosphoglycerate-independent phosphoglycerate mutase [Balneolaceae bacterium]